MNDLIETYLQGVTKEAKVPFGKPSMGNVPWNKVDPDDDEEIWQAKLDGAFVYYLLDEDGIKAYSHRRSKKTGKPIEHTKKLRGLTEVEVPKRYWGSILEGEAWAPGKPSRVVGGILNTRKDPEYGALRPALHGISKLNGSDVPKLNEHQKIKLLRKIQKDIPVFDLPDTASTKEEKEELKKKIDKGHHPQTDEGIVVYPREDMPYKSVIYPTHDLPVVGITEGGGRHEGKAVGAILVGPPENPTRVGTGLSDILRRVLYDNPDLTKGLVARVAAKEVFPSGKLRAPALKDFHPEKSEPTALEKLDKKIEREATKTAKDEFAPGIPSSRTIQNIPNVTKDTWELSIQEHDAHTAGKHWDLRLGSRGNAYSWAIPKARLPRSRGTKLLAIEQPTHTIEYMDFAGTIPSGYGAGSVKLVERDQVTVTTSKDTVKFEVPGKGKFTLRRMQGDKWLLMKSGG